MEFKSIRDGDGERERNAGSKVAAAIAAHRVAVRLISSQCVCVAKKLLRPLQIESVHWSTVSRGF